MDLLKQAANAISSKTEDFIQHQKFKKALNKMMASQLTDVTTEEMYLVADKSYEYLILENILNRLTSAYSNSRRILNTLNLIDFLLKNGSSKFKGEIEDEKYFLSKMKENYTDPYDELHKPISNNIEKILNLLTDQEVLKREREQAKNIRERFKGVSSHANDNQYGSYSSEEIKKEIEYDIKTEVNLQKKLGIFENEEKEEKTEEVVQEEPQEFVDFLEETQEEKEPEKPVKKMRAFLPPPPKKGQNQKRYHKQKSTEEMQETNEIDFLNQQQENTSQENYQNAQDFLNLEEPKKPVQDDYLNFMAKNQQQKAENDKYDVFSQ